MPAQGRWRQITGYRMFAPGEPPHHLPANNLECLTFSSHRHSNFSLEERFPPGKKVASAQPDIG
jgi:hypothetical protein